MTGQEGVKTHVQKGASGYCARHSSSSSTAVHQHRPLETGSSSYCISCMGRWGIVGQVGMMPLHPRVPQIATTSIHTAHVYRSIASFDCTCSASQPLYNKAKKHMAPDFQGNNTITQSPPPAVAGVRKQSKQASERTLAIAVQAFIMRHCCPRAGVCAYPTAHRWLQVTLHEPLQSWWMVDKVWRTTNTMHCTDQPTCSNMLTDRQVPLMHQALTAADKQPALSAHAGSYT